MKRVIFYILGFVIFLSGGLLGICALAGVCGVLWGPEVFQDSAPAGNQPYFYFMLILLAPFMLLGFATSSIVVILLASWMKIPLIEKKSWKYVVSIYRFVKNSRYEASLKAIQNETKRRETLRKINPAVYYLCCLIIGGLGGKLWSILFFAAMNYTGDIPLEPSNFEKNFLPIGAFALVGLLGGWLNRTMTLKSKNIQ